jgi:hypothetical protein
MKKLTFDDLDSVFKAEILSRKPESNSSNILIYSDQKRVLYRADKEDHYIGCEFCIINKIKNNNLGYPCIENMDLICLYDLQKDSSIPQDIALNIWLCPVCNKILIKPHIGMNNVSI